jgi:hypothetical protein
VKDEAQKEDKEEEEHGPSSLSSAYSPGSSSPLPAVIRKRVHIRLAAPKE